MIDRGFVSQQWINVQNIPNNIQKNGAQINPLLRQYIFNGESCEYSEDIRRSLMKFTGAEGIKYIAFLVMIVFISVRSFRKFSEANANDTAWLAAATLMPAAVITAILVFFMLRMSLRRTALRLADKGGAMCFKYNLYGKICYEKYSDENEYLYYADLGDFCVNISKNAGLGCTVTGMVVNVKGTEYFYLLV